MILFINFHEIAMHMFFDSIHLQSKEELTITRVESMIQLCDPCFDYFHKMKWNIPKERHFS